MDVESSCRPVGRASVIAVILIGAALAVPPLALADAEPARGNPARGPDFDGDGFYDLAIGAPGENDGAGAVTVLYGGATGLSAARTQVWDESTVGSANGPAPGERFGAAVAWGDFDSDGFYDLAIGAPGETVTGETVTGETLTGPGADSGVVFVVRGSSTGLVSAGGQRWDRTVDGLAGSPTRRDGFGSALVGRDFDGDKIDDLAIGVPGADHPKDAGAVQILRGTPTGLSVADNQLIRQPGNRPRKHEAFGYVLAGGHLDEADLRFELVASARDTVSGRRAAGAVTVMYGTADGVSTDLVQRWTRATPGIVGAPRKGDWFGRSLAIADIDRDDNSDLAAGLKGSGHGRDDPGAVAVLYGTLTGLGSDRNEVWAQGDRGVPGTPTSGDAFGADVTLADFDDDGFNDLAVGVPGEDDTSADGVGLPDAGAVTVLYGTATGLSTVRVQTWTTAAFGLAPAAGDRLGATLTRGDFDSTARIDLVIGVPGATGAAGAADVLYGTPGGLSGSAHQRFDQSTAGGGGVAEPGDSFGAALMWH
jgi:hypothetical protein